MSKLEQFIYLLFCCAMLLGCGQKGGLYIPQHSFPQAVVLLTSSPQTTASPKTELQTGALLISAAPDRAHVATSS